MFHENWITLEMWLDKRTLSSDLSLAVTKQRKSLFQLTSDSPSLRVSEQKHKQESGGRHHKRILLSGLLLDSCTTSFLLQLRPTFLGMVPSTED